MIFVTVGTHEQQFNRLIQCIDDLVGNGIIAEDVIMQIGYSTYIPKYCEWDKMISYDEMINNVKRARIVITHGGPASFLMPIQLGKVPIVVPRQHQYDEHINNHQLEFVRFVSERLGNIIPIYEIENLEKCIKEYQNHISGDSVHDGRNNKLFCESLEKHIDIFFDDVRY